MRHNILSCPCQAAIIKESGPKAPDPATGAHNSQTHFDTLAASSRQDLLFSFVYVLCVSIKQHDAQEALHQQFRCLSTEVTKLFHCAFHEENLKPLFKVAYAVFSEPGMMYAR